MGSVSSRNHAVHDPRLNMEESNPYCLEGKLASGIYIRGGYFYWV